MTLPRLLKKRLAKEEFYPGLIAFLTSPYFITRHHLVKAIRTHAPRLGGNILDFGCGSKPYEGLFAHAQSYVGVDVETSGHDHSTSRVDHFYKDAHLPFEDQTFDSIVSFEVFEHVVDLEPMVAELFRVAKPGALALITTPFLFPEHETPYDFRRLTRYGLEHILTKSGFEIIRIEPTTGPVLAITQSFNHFIFREATPVFTVAKIITHFTITIPATILGYIFHFLLPRGSSLYINLVVLARKPKTAGSIMASER